MCGGQEMLKEAIAEIVAANEQVQILALCTKAELDKLKDKAKLKEVEDAGKALGKTAVDGELKGQESNSPSKATIRAGKYLGEGLIIGLKNISNKVYGEGQKLGKRTASSLSDILFINT